MPENKETPSKIAWLQSHIPELVKHIPESVIDEIPSVAEHFEIDTPIRLAHFLGQCAHESINFTAVRENLNYSEAALLKVFSKYFTPETAKEYARKPEKIANRVYGGRMGNGPESSGDGWAFRGRGYIQLTSRGNYTSFSKSIDAPEILDNPDLVATDYPLLSAAWYWDSRNINALADSGFNDDTIKAVTRVINGGYNGLEDRIAKTRKFATILLTCRV